MSGGVPYDEIRSFFERGLEAHGATPKGVHWNSDHAQVGRFAQLLKLIQTSDRFSIIDYGCGYGALIDQLQAAGYAFDYYGYDLLESMVQQARQQYGQRADCTFTSDKSQLPVADYTIASGVFNVKFEASYQSWTGYVLETLHELDRLSRRGFSFNMLTRYSDPGKMRPELYYADPGFIFNYCASNFARSVALLHDYQIYDFTIIVRKES